MAKTLLDSTLVIELERAATPLEVAELPTELYAPQSLAFIEYQGSVVPKFLQAKAFEAPVQCATAGGLGRDPLCIYKGGGCSKL